MPAYDYKCGKCGHEQEEYHSVTDRNCRVVCNSCVRVTTRIISSHIERTKPTWLPDAVQHAVPQGSDVRRPTDRNEFNKYLKNNQVDMIG